MSIPCIGVRLLTQCSVALGVFSFRLVRKHWNTHIMHVRYTKRRIDSPPKIRPSRLAVELVLVVQAEDLGTVANVPRPTLLQCIQELLTRMPSNLRVAQLPLWQNLPLMALPRCRLTAFARNWKMLWRQVMPQRLGGRHVACPRMIEQNYQAQILGVKGWRLIGLICGAVAHRTCPPEEQPPMALMVVGTVQPQGRRMGSVSATSAPLNACIHETSFCSRTTVGKKRPCMKWNPCKTDTPLSRISVGGRWKCVNTFSCAEIWSGSNCIQFLSSGRGGKSECNNKIDKIAEVNK